MVFQQWIVLNLSIQITHLNIDTYKAIKIQNRVVRETTKYHLGVDQLIHFNYYSLQNSPSYLSKDELLMKNMDRWKTIRHS